MPPGFRAEARGNLTLTPTERDYWGKKLRLAIGALWKKKEKKRKKREREKEVNPSVTKMGHMFGMQPEITNPQYCSSR